MRAGAFRGILAQTEKLSFSVFERGGDKADAVNRVATKLDNIFVEKRVLPHPDHILRHRIMMVTAPERNRLAPTMKEKYPMDYFDKFLLTVGAYNKKYPDGNTPFQTITRLCEEAGELASAVNHFEDTGVKRLKHGPPDRQALAREVQDVIRAALSVARYYEIEQELRDAIDQSYQTKVEEGYILD